MANYEIVLNLTGNSVAEMTKIESELKRLGVTADREMKRVGESVEQTEHSFEKLQHRIAEVFAVREIYEFGKHVLEVTAEFEGFENRIKFASMNTVDATQNMAFLRREVEQLHLPMRQVFEGFSEMQAGLKGTGIEGTHLRTLFDGISTAAATLHLPQYQLQRTLYDLKEIGEIGINMRIARSLSTALPGIGGIVKQAFGGKSMHELEKEHISGPEFLEKLGPALKRTFEGGLANYADSLQAKMNDVSNKFLSSQVDLGEKLKPVYMAIMSQLTDTIGQVNRVIGYLSQHSDELRKIWNVVEVLGISWGVYKIAVIGADIATKAYGVTAGIVENIMIGLQGQMTLTEIAMEGLNTVIASTGFGAIAIAVGFAIKSFIDWNSEIDKTIEKLSSLGDIGSTFERDQKEYSDLMTSYNAYLKDPSSFTEKEKESLATGLSGYAQRQHTNVVTKIQPHLQAVKDSLAVPIRTPSGSASISDIRFGQYGPIGRDIETHKREAAAADSLANIDAILNRQIGVVQGALALPQLSKALHRAGKFNPVGDTAEHSTHLAGAEGGLGQAKIINIKIDRVMTVENHDNKNLVGHAEVAADYIIRTANNFAESQSGTY